MLSKPLAQLNAEDLGELLKERAVENFRLEFKSEMPGKEETLKKLSSFANTYGGYLIVGAKADSSDGRLIDLPGVAIEAGYKQRIVQWCFQSINPPMVVEVSDPIPIKKDSGKVCYVLYVQESDLAPHFINGRKGIYVRTDEFSQRFEPKLAVAVELKELFDRRKTVVEKRTFLINRARTRFDSFVKARYSDLGSRKNGIGARFNLAIIPRFPARELLSQTEIFGFLKQVKVPWRQTNFPRTTQGVISQHESSIVLRPGSVFSLLESNVYGLHFYASEIERKEDKYSGVHLNAFLGNLLVFLRHACEMNKRIGVMGPLKLEMQLEGIRGAPWVYFIQNQPEQGPASLLDDSALFSLSLSAEELNARTDDVFRQLIAQVFFAMNWADRVEKPAQLSELVRAGYEFNYWPKNSGDTSLNSAVSEIG